MMLQFYSFRQALLLFCVFLLSVSGVVMAQVGINTADPNINAVLDLSTSSFDGGLLLPRVELDSINQVYPEYGQHVAGMVLYNTGGEMLSEGYYYNNGTQWVRFIDEKELWKLTGNTDIGNDGFLGTLNEEPLKIKTVNTERMRILTDGKVIINDADEIYEPYISMLNVFSNGSIESLRGEAVNGNAVNGLANGGENAIHGSTNDKTKFGIYAENYLSYGLFGLGTFKRRETNAGYALIAFSGENAPSDLSTKKRGAALKGKNYGAVGYGTNKNQGIESGIGLVGVSPRSQNIVFPGSGISATGGNGVYGVTNSSTGTGVVGLQGNFDVDTDNIINGVGTGVAGIGEYFGFYTAVFDRPLSSFENPSAGGYFVSNSSVRIAAWECASSFLGVCVSWRAHKIIGPGSANTLVKDIKNEERIMYTTATPESLLIDFGEGRLENGEVYIHLDPVFSKNISVAEQNPLKVLIQLEDDCLGVYVTEKSEKGFKVKELKNGKSNARFSWRVAGNRANESVRDTENRVINIDYSGRFNVFNNETNINNK